MENSIGLVTALTTRLGYAASTKIAMEALATGRGVAELVLEHGLLTAEQLDELLRPELPGQPQRVAPRRLRPHPFHARSTLEHQLPRHSPRGTCA